MLNKNVIMKILDNQIRIGPYSFSDRELGQIIRRKMITKSFINKKKFNKSIDRKHFKIYE